MTLSFGLSGSGDNLRAQAVRPPTGMTVSNASFLKEAKSVTTECYGIYTSNEGEMVSHLSTTY